MTIFIGGPVHGRHYDWRVRHAEISIADFHTGLIARYRRIIGPLFLYWGSRPMSSQEIGKAREETSR